MLRCFLGISVFAFAQEPLTHDHLREHGGQVYQATKIDTGWTQNEEGESSFLLNWKAGGNG